VRAEAFLFDAVRTPCGRGRRDGALRAVKPVSLVAGLVDALRKRHPSLDTDQVGDLLLGVAAPVGDQGGNLARAAALVAGLPPTAGGAVVSRAGASGIDALALAAARVRAGDDDLLLAGGVEVMSRVPAGADGGALGLDPATSYLTRHIPAGVSADLLATVTGLDRADLDAYAARSRRLTSEAWAGGFFDETVIAVQDHGLDVLDHDERVGRVARGDRSGSERQDAVAAFLAGLAPSFVQPGEHAGFDAVALQTYHWLEKVEHGHTAGSSAGPADGAALLLVGSERAENVSGLTPRARIVASATGGADPTLALTGPAAATRALLARAGLSAADVDLFEIDEAFAAVPLSFQRDLAIPVEKINTRGGAVALGQPLGAAGSMMTATALSALEHNGACRAVIALSAGAGTGVAVLLERP
jgi:acetyl-CoA C-acetyltransferase